MVLTLPNPRHLNHCDCSDPPQTSPCFTLNNINISWGKYYCGSFCRKVPVPFQSLSDSVRDENLKLTCIGSVSAEVQKVRELANIVRRENLDVAEKFWGKEVKIQILHPFFGIKNCIVATDVRFFLKVWKIFTFVKNSPKNQVWSEKSDFFKYSMYKEVFLQSMNIPGVFFRCLRRHYFLKSTIFNWFSHPDAFWKLEHCPEKVFF